jgi:hypothetical protein
MATSGPISTATAAGLAANPALSTTTVGDAGAAGATTGWGIRSTTVPGPRPVTGGWAIDLLTALLRPTLVWGAGYCDMPAPRRTATLTALRAAATSEIDGSNRQTARAALRGIHCGIIGAPLSLQYASSLAALEEMQALAEHPRPTVSVHPLTGTNSWFALALRGPGFLQTQLVARSLLGVDEMPANWAALVSTADEVTMPLAAPDLESRVGLLHYFVQTHWEAFTERPPVRLLRQLAKSGNMRTELGESTAVALAHALSSPTTAVPANIASTFSGSLMKLTAVRDNALRRTHLVCVRAATRSAFLRGSSGWQVLAYLHATHPCALPSEEFYRDLPAGEADALCFYSVHLDLPRAPSSIRELLPGGAFSGSRAQYLCTTQWAREYLEEHAAPKEDSDQTRMILLRWWDTHGTSSERPGDKAAIAQMLDTHGGIPPPRAPGGSSSSSTDSPSELADFIASLGGAPLMDRIYFDSTETARHQNRQSGGPLPQGGNSGGQNWSPQGPPFIGGNSQTFGS